MILLNFGPSIFPTLTCLLRVIFVVSSPLLDLYVPALVKKLPTLCVAVIVT